MAGASGEGGDYGGDEVSAEMRVLMERNMHLALLTIAQSVPYLWPMILNCEWEFPSICTAGRDFELAYLAQPPTITLRLRDEAAWSAAYPCLMEMRLGKRVFPTLSVRVEGLHAYGLYTIFLDLMPMSQNVHEYWLGLWTPLQTTKLYPPPNLASLICVSRTPVRLGSVLMARGMNFSFVKITADTSPPINRDEIFVHRGQIYLPRYHIVRHFTEAEASLRQYSAGMFGNVLLAPLEYIGTYVIPGTAFVAVDNYYSWEKNKGWAQCRASVSKSKVPFASLTILIDRLLPVVYPLTLRIDR
ncbi:putative T-box protein 7 [Taenia solium]|eukprot:TsM_001114100 transcript=TsM_001114100 gene=TsM_001114100